LWSVQRWVCCCLLLFATPQTLTSQLAVAEKKVTAQVGGITHLERVNIF
jgi:hypothetical protein